MWLLMIRVHICTCLYNGQLTMNIKVSANEGYENTTVSFYVHTYVHMYVCMYVYV